ncbi:MAG TPA: twin-arginine translocase TatA/TatE family subunit [Thermomicrobiales bacterium]|nr:twin-arginine translocase TatA/TatE family subunit [Thermomicrobiales bacterium]
MGPIGIPELAIVLVIVVIIFGVGKLPEVGSSLGKGIRQFKAESGGDSEIDSRPSAAVDTGTVPSPLATSARADAPRSERRDIRADDI